MKANLLIGIYDEDVLRADLLHNILDHMGYDIAFSHSSLKELFEGLGRPPALLIFGTVQNPDAVISVIRKIRKQQSSLRILLLANLKNKKSHSNLADKHQCRTIINASFRILLDELEKILPEHPLNIMNNKLTTDIFTHPVLPDNPFFKIVSDAEKFTVLKLLAEGKSTKEIADETGIPHHRVNSIRKQIIHETDSKNVTHSVSKGKDQHVI